jgi:hypothetical protein
MRRNNFKSFALAMAAIEWTLYPMGKFPPSESPLTRIDIQTKVGRKCRLPGCDNLTTHNGGYCCAEHCRQHARQ